MGITEVLTLIFVILKLLHKIDWSWFWVLSPEIIAIIFYIVIYVISIAVAIKTDIEIEKSFRDWRDL